MRERRKIICFLMMLLLITPSILLSRETASTPIKNNDEETRAAPTDDQIDQSQTHWDKWWRMLIVFPNAQSFVPTLDTLTRVELLLGREGTPKDDLKVSIREKLEKEDLTAVYIPMEEIPRGKYNMTWVMCDFPDIQLEPGRTYYIVCESEEKDEKQAYSWAFSQEDRYSYGCRWYLHPISHIWRSNEEVDTCFKTYGSNIMHPYKPERPSGPSMGKIGQSYAYSTYTSDPKNLKVRYCFDWGDGNTTWTDFYDSGEKVECSHTWQSKGNFSIKVKAENEEGYESMWSEPLIVSMPKIYTHSTLLKRINEWLMRIFGEVFFLQAY